MGRNVMILYFWFLIRFGGNWFKDCLPTHIVLDCVSLFLQQNRQAQLQHLQIIRNMYFFHFFTKFVFVSKSEFRLQFSKRIEEDFINSMNQDMKYVLAFRIENLSIHSDEYLVWTGPDPFMVVVLPSLFIGPRHQLGAFIQSVGDIFHFMIIFLKVFESNRLIFQ